MPLSKDFHFLSPITITIERGDRQRAEIEVEDLLDSVRVHGIMNPLIVNRAGTLVAGERRLTAALELGLDEVPVRYIDELSTLELRTLELEENLKRSQLPWKDLVRAVLDIERIMREDNPSVGYPEICEQLGVTKTYLSRVFLVGRFLEDPLVAEQTTLISAWNVAKRKVARQTQDAMSDVMSASGEVLRTAFASPPVAAPASGAPMPPVAGGTVLPLRSAPPPSSSSRPVDTTDETILLEDFLAWAPKYSGPRFNFLHCDFPYGVNLFDGNKLKGHGKYGDTSDIYFRLIECLCTYRDTILTANAHIMFWFSMEHYIKTRKMFAQLAPDIIFSNFPLVWVKSDNAGLLPDGNRQPRRIYETALLGTRGDRFVAKAISNAYSAPTNRKLHPSTKPEPVLKHFFQLFVDDSTRMLDPTCGGGSSIRAAESMGAEFVLGLEVDPQYHANACGALREARLMANASKAIIKQAKEQGRA